MIPPPAPPQKNPKPKKNPDKTKLKVLEVSFSVGVAEHEIFQNKSGDIWEATGHCLRNTNFIENLYRQVRMFRSWCLTLLSVWNKVFPGQLNGFSEWQLFWGACFFLPRLLSAFKLWLILLYKRESLGRREWIVEITRGSAEGTCNTHLMSFGGKMTEPRVVSLLTI